MSALVAWAVDYLVALGYVVVSHDTLAIIERLEAGEWLSDDELEIVRDALKPRVARWLH